jgi:hypothetical protein
VPDAPPGKVCIYIASNTGVTLASISGVAGLLPEQSFELTFMSSGAVNTDEAVRATWAYTAP